MLMQWSDIASHTDDPGAHPAGPSPPRGLRWGEGRAPRTMRCNGDPTHTASRRAAVWHAMTALRQRLPGAKSHQPARIAQPDFYVPSAAASQFDLCRPPAYDLAMYRLSFAARLGRGRDWSQTLPGPVSLARKRPSPPSSIFRTPLTRVMSKSTLGSKRAT